MASGSSDKTAGFLAVCIVTAALCAGFYQAGLEVGLTKCACHAALVAAHTEADSLRVELAGCPIKELGR